MSLTPFIAALSEAAATAPQSPDAQLIDLDGTIFVQLGIFAVVAFLLTQLLWKPYLRVKTERIRRVDGYRDEAKRMERDSEERLARCEAQLADARRAGSAERARARAEGQALETRLVSEAQSSAQKALADAALRVEASLAAEKATLMARAELLGREAAERVLGRKVVS